MRHRDKELTHSRFIVSRFCRMAAKWTYLFYSTRDVFEGRDGIMGSLTSSFQNAWATCNLFNKM
jgi:hypothetical protein